MTYPLDNYDMCSRCYRLTDYWCDWEWCEVCWHDEGHDLLVITARQFPEDFPPQVFRAMLEEWHAVNRQIKNSLRQEDR